VVTDVTTTSNSPANMAWSAIGLAVRLII
jgi:hypothetical protein